MDHSKKQTIFSKIAGSLTSILLIVIFVLVGYVTWKYLVLPSQKVKNSSIPTITVTPKTNITGQSYSIIYQNKAVTEQKYTEVAISNEAPLAFSTLTITFQITNNNDTPMTLTADNFALEGNLGRYTPYVIENANTGETLLHPHVATDVKAIYTYSGTMNFPASLVVKEPNGSSTTIQIQ